jgi:hypothetical protein
VPDAAGLAAVASLCVGFYPALIFRSYTATCAVLLLLGGLGLVELTRAALKREEAAVAGLVLVAWIVLAALLSGETLLALKGTVGRDASGLIVVGVVAAWAFAREMSESARAVVPYLMVVCLAVSGLVGLGQVLFDLRSGALALQFGRATGLTPNPVYFGGLMAGGAVLAATLKAVPDAIRWGVVALFGMCTNLSGSRVAVVAAVVILASLIVANPQRSVLIHRSTALAMFVIGVGIAAGVTTLLVDSSSSTARGLEDGGGRLEAWRYGFAAIVDRPIAGWGYGRFRAATQGRFTPEFVQAAASDDLRQAWFDAHNVLINTAVSIGLVGLGIFLWWVWASRRVAPPTLGFASTVALTWLAQPAGLATLPLVAIAWGAGSQVGDAAHNPQPHARPRSCRRVSIVLLAVGGLAAVAIVTADLRLRHALDLGEPTQVEDAAAWFPGDSVVADLVAQAWLQEDQGDLAAARAIEWSRRAVDREPDRPYLWSRLALRQLLLADRAGATRSAEHALALQPWHLQSWQILYVLGRESDDQTLLDRSSAALCALGEDLEECSPAKG